MQTNRNASSAPAKRRFNRSFGSSSGTFISRPSRPGFGRPQNSRWGSKPKRQGEKIDIAKFINKSSLISKSDNVIIRHTFDDFALCSELKKNLSSRGYATPTPIQDQSIPHIVEGRDLIGLANTGTGKTAAFLLPLINKVFANRSEKVLIIAPTRELASQIENEFRQFSWSMRLFSTLCVGGLPVFGQINNLRRNPNFVIGTPGRLKDLKERGIIKFETFSNIVLDEVDRMLDMGFVDEIKEILSVLPATRHSLFFSATMPDKIRVLVTQFLKNPVLVEIKSTNTAENVDQDIVRVRDRAMKFNQLQELLSQPGFEKVLIFSETKRDVEKLTGELVGKGFRAQSIHGDKKQRERQRALAQFKESAVNILVATDVAARGLDIKNVSHVINYTIPQTYNDYIHRIGRTGRAGKKGIALTFVESR